MNPYFLLVITILVGFWVLDVVTEVLNLRAASGDLPAEFRDVWDDAEYRRSQDYLRDNTRLSLAGGTAQTLLILALILGGGFDAIDRLARALVSGEILRGLVLVGLVLLASYLVGQPFRLYRTFGIEARYGFNRTTLGTYLLDRVKELLLVAAIGGLFLAALIWFFQAAGHWAWLIAWAAATAFQIVVMYLAPILIMPLFNKFTPLADDTLRARIEAYAESQGFAISGIFTMDASKRTAKGNAYFTGFGKLRRVVFFDTLLEQTDPDGLLNIMAHEIGHCKHRDTHKMLAMSVLTMGLLLGALQILLRNPDLFAAFRMTQPPTIYASVVFIAIVLQPASLVLGVIANAWSRRFEYRADAFAVRTRGPAETMVAALKKLTADNLVNLTPHPLKVLLEYSHPPILARIRALREVE